MTVVGADPDVTLSAVAHALAEPVLVLRAHAAGRPGPEGRAVDRLTTILDGLVRLASADRAADRELVAIGPLLERHGGGVVVVHGTAADAVVEGDTALVGLLVGELLANVRDHGGGVASVDAHAAAGGAWVLEVTDRGPGLPAARPSPVDPFRRGPGVEGRAHAGVGLDVCRRVAAAHGGRLDIGMGPDGVGLRVRISVPPRW